MRQTTRVATHAPATHSLLATLAHGASGLTYLPPQDIPMQLWTDYEGVTIDNTFRLQKLLMPEGRSAFYSTTGLNGEPTVLRLIECHFDEEKILARWRCMDALSHPNFLKFERFGQTQLDGFTVVYAVFEKVDANLAEVLDQGILTTPDAAQLASSLVAALDVLHSNGFIHEHVEPRNIFAVNSVVKLRSDCIREAPEGEEARAAKQRDVRDLATVLLQGLTQRDSLDTVPPSSLPAPFNQIIPNALNGTWTLDHIRAALGRQFGSNLPPAPTPAPPTAEQKAPTEPEAQLPLPLRNQDRPLAPTRSATTRPPAPHLEPDTFSLRSRWIAAGVAALLLILITWALAHTWTTHHPTTPQPTAISQPAPQPPSPPTVSTTAPTAVAAPAATTANWRVIAFTYNRRADADKKASDLTRSHPDLNPTVFTPTGHAPYLVAIGGRMDSAAAHALARRSRSLGLPRDSYAQNYSR